jgi:vanillate O-demethylase ferredoxin subunit
MNAQMFDVEVASKAWLADDIVSIVLVRSEGVELPTFTAGSHIDVHLAEGVIRQYSLWNNPSDTHRYCLGVLEETGGRGGSKMVHQLRTGDKLKISAPRNNFSLHDDAKHSLLIAGGIGVTPILSMASALHESGAEFTLHYCTRSPERMAFQQLLDSCEFADRVHLHFDNGADEQRFDIGSLAEPPEVGTHLYVCGPAGFMDAVLGAADSEWPPHTVHREYFSADVNEPEGGNQAFRVQVKSTGDILEVTPEQSIVEALAGVGIDIPTACGQGVCGTCITPVLQGKPDHRDLVLTEEEHAENLMILCCSRSLSDLLVLDL